MGYSIWSPYRGIDELSRGYWLVGFPGGILEISAIFQAQGMGNLKITEKSKGWFEFKSTSRGSKASFQGIGWYFSSVKSFLERFLNTPVWNSNGIAQ